MLQFDWDTLKMSLLFLQLYELVEDEGQSLLHFTVPRELAGGFINNKKETYKFK